MNSSTAKRAERTSPTARSTGHRLRRSHPMDAHLRRRLGQPPGSSDTGQVAIVLVLGLILTMTLGTTIFVVSTMQTFPIVQQNLASHYAYRALEAGLNEYEYEIDTNPNLVLCNASNLALAQCQALQPFKFGQWNLVPNSGNAGSPKEWFSVYPVLDTVHSLVKAFIDGAAQSSGGYTYKSATITFQPENSFLLNDWWSVHGLSDPGTFYNNGGNYNDPYNPSYPSWGGSSCTISAASEKGTSLHLFWGTQGTSGATKPDSEALPYPSGCASSNNLSWSGPGTVFNGPIFSDDPLMVCSFGSSGSVDVGSTTPWMPITTAAPMPTSGKIYDPEDGNTYTLANGYSNYGCTNDLGNTSPNSYVNSNVKQTVTGTGQLRPPGIVGAMSKLSKIAKSDGCLYAGPTVIKLDGTSGMIVSSPDTGSTGTDKFNASTNTNQCLPSVAGQPVPLPANGVVAIMQPQSGCVSGANILVNQYPLSTGPGYFGEGPTDTLNCEADAIVGNDYYDPGNSANKGLSGSLTIAAANDVVIDNSITYDDCGTNGNVLPGPSATSSSSCQLSSTKTNDVLGLIAGKYVELNNPMRSPYAACCVQNSYGWASYYYDYNNKATCGPGGGIACTLINPRIDAVVTALTHDFAVNMYPFGNQNGTITLDGSMDQYFADIEGTAGGGGGTGYSNVYNWDHRLTIISPPYYLTPGNNAWSVAASVINPGAESQYAPAGSP